MGRTYPRINRREGGTFSKDEAGSEEASVAEGALRQGRATKPLARGEVSRQSKKMSSLPRRDSRIGSYVEINAELCKGCKLCIAFCPKQRIRVSRKLNKKGMFIVEFLDKEGTCTGCAQCALMCPEAAIEVLR